MQNLTIALYIFVELTRLAAKRPWAALALAVMAIIIVAVLVGF